MSAIEDRLVEVRTRIARACLRCGRPADGVRLVAVSKTVEAERVRDLVRAGHDLLGENRVQEALRKIESVGPGVRWHLVGRLQRNKARHAVGTFELIHSVDDLDLAIELDRRAAARGIVQCVLVQLNLSREETKSGVDESVALPLIDSVLKLEHLDLRGLMTIPSGSGPTLQDSAIGATGPKRRLERAFRSCRWA